MKILKYNIAFILILLATVACVKEDNLFSLEHITAPENVNAVFDVTQDNTGLVTIIPNSEGATSYSVDFGDGTSAELKMLERVTHIYTEGVYQVEIAAHGITGLTTTITKELNVTFKAPENLVVTIKKDVVNPRKVSVSATATYATVIDVYFGDVVDEEATHVLPGEEATYTYEEPGDYEIRVVAKSAGSETTEYTETVTIEAASDPVNLPVNFESFTVNYAFVDFGGVVSSVVDNPDPSGINTSSKVGQSEKTAGAETWGGTILTLEAPIDFSSKKEFKIKVWSPKANAVVKLKVENLNDGNIAHEVDAVTTVANEWEELTFDFAAIDVAQEYQKVVLFFDFGNVGDGAVYFFDDIRLVSAPTMGSGIEGIWKVAPEAGSMGVGPGPGDLSWWAIDDAEVSRRACFFDDTYVFNTDGTFSNVLGSETWLEGWQSGSADACGVPVAPHDGTAAATFSYDQNAGTVTVYGKGAYLGIPKVINGGELTNPQDAPESITYNVELNEDKTEMIIDIDVDGAWWRFKLVKEADFPSSPIEGSWSIAPEAGSLGVGPNLGDISWWAITDSELVERACLYDDVYVFGADGSFSNVLGAETWIEDWQGGSNSCGTPVAPHDGSAVATYTYDADAGTITLNGTGAFLGIPKVYNGGELGNPLDAPVSVTYDVSLSEDNMVMTLDISTGAAWWRFKLVKN
ncbi:hypothetical protein SAMN05444274_103454 [Mariniphaga anaerophila]|uniref:PKD/Chitinase domain-containing protein n=1 Tax=Mariniphaga anaerophila TaxID=1484053 RepID=A0A1M4YTJ0_9BACT|nr:PKD domain-containing protein [Mariniphaga anaerophila]SHF08877.1 hypothetical protein SAMN05444274_103454 [Mariniphaga anaerophila]